MAIFSYNEELERQGTHKPMDKVRGFQKTALALMGYKDDGSRNQWGKISSVLPNPVGTVGKHQLARALTKGTDTRKVLDETQDENLAMGLSQLKTALEVGKLVATGGTSGALGGSLGGSLTSMGTGSTGQIASKALQSGGLGGGTDIANMSADNLLNYTDMLGGDNNTSTFSKLGSSKPSDMVKKMMADEETKFMTDELMKTAENTDVSDLVSTQNKIGGTKGNQFLDLLGEGVPLFEAGLEQYAATKSFNKELERESEKYKNRTILRDNANII